jgi:hypothetical protein
MAQTVSTALALSFALSAALASHQRVPKPGSPASSISIEVESLIGAAQVTQGKAVPQDMRPFGTGWSGDAQLFWGGAQIGSELRLLLTSAATGRYEIFLHFTRAPDHAFAQASFDGAPATSFNGYATSVSRDRAFLGMIDLAPGTHELLIKVTMKDGPSKGLNVGLDRIEFVPVTAAGAPAPPENRPGFAGLGGSLTQRVDVPAGASGIPAVPVVHIDADADPEPPQRTSEAVEPLSMPSRLAIAQRATPQPVHGPGKPIHLSAETPNVPAEGSISLYGGSAILYAYSKNGEIRIWGPASLQLSYPFLQAKKPYLLECGVHFQTGGGSIEMSTLVNGTDKPLASVSLPAGGQRVMVMLIPEKSHMSIRIKAVGKAVEIRYCDLTPFD